MPEEEPRFGLGTTVYTEDGTRIGRVRGVDEDGVYVTRRDGLEGLSVQHVRAGKSLGEAELVWRCLACGELRPLEGSIPDSCPACGAPREELYYWTED